MFNFFSLFLSGLEFGGFGCGWRFFFFDNDERQNVFIEFVKDFKSAQILGEKMKLFLIVEGHEDFRRASIVDDFVLKDNSVIGFSQFGITKHIDNVSDGSNVLGKWIPFIMNSLNGLKIDEFPLIVDPRFFVFVFSFDPFVSDVTRMIPNASETRRNKSTRDYGRQRTKQRHDNDLMT